MDELFYGMTSPLWDADGGGAGGGDQDPGDDGDQDQDQGDDGDKGDKTPKNMVPISRLNEVIAKGKAEKSRADKLEKEIKKLQDTGKSETQKMQDQINTLTASMEGEKYQRLRLEVAGKHSIPQELITRLQGETEEELETDAVALKEFLKLEQEDDEDQGGPGSPPPGKRGRGKNNFDIRGKSPAEIRQAYKDGKLSLS